MALTELQVEEALSLSINTTDSTWDTTQGPIPDVMIRPQAGQLAVVSQQAQDLRTLFTLQFPSVATSTEVQLALGNFGSSPGAGGFSQCVQYFLRYSAPTADIVIPVGALVSNSDSSLTYQVVVGGTIYLSSVSSFYNPARNAYEIGLLVQATGTGPNYDLPAYRINTLVTPIPGIDSTENRLQSTGGISPETSTNQSARLINALKGLNKGSPNGIVTEITNSLTEITDVAVIQPYQPEFTRVVSGPALDIYVIGTNITTYTETQVAISNQTQIYPTKKPVNSITSLTVNGTSGVVSYTLVPDSSSESGYSLDSGDVVVVDPPLVSGDIVVLQYTYNQALSDVYSVVFASGSSYLFNTDMLIRSPFPVNPLIEGEVRILPSYSIPDIENAIDAFNSTELNFTNFQSSLLYTDYRNALLSSVPGIQSFRITAFRRNMGSLADIENIYLSSNEILVENTDLINIRVIT